MRPWIAKNLVYRTTTLIRGEPVFRILARYEESQWWSPEQLQAHQAEGVTRLLRYAASRTPYYGKIAHDLGIEPKALQAEDLTLFPRLQKQDLVNDTLKLQAPRLPATTSWKTTGGSTGVAVRLRKNRWATAAEQAASWRSYRWYGVQPGQRQARFWGTPLSGRTRLRARAIDWVLNRSRFSAFAFTPADLDRYFGELCQSRPEWAYGYVSMLVQFARHCLDNDLPLADLGLRCVVTTSEVLTEPDRSLIQRAFGAPVFNEYGCGEVGAVLYECPEGSLHAMAENLLLELVPDPTEQEPDARSLLVTDLHNRATPLIRYEIGDRVVPAPPCRCGRALPAFRKIFGRAYDFIETEDGTRYHGEFFMYMLESARDQGAPIFQAQFEQESPRSLRINLVPREGYEPAVGEALSQQIERASEGRLSCQIAVVPELVRENSGKLRLIRSLAPERANSMQAMGRIAPGDAPRHEVKQ